MPSASVKWSWAGVQRVALLKSFPQRGIAHNDGVDDAVFVKRKLVLAQNAHLLGRVTEPLVESSSPVNIFIKCGFASAIGPVMA